MLKEKLSEKKLANSFKQATMLNLCSNSKGVERGFWGIQEPQPILYSKTSRFTAGP